VIFWETSTSGGRDARKSNKTFFSHRLKQNYCGPDKTDFDQAQVDMLIDCYEDTVKPGLKFYLDKDEESKVAGKKKFLEEYF